MHRKNLLVYAVLGLSTLGAASQSTNDASVEVAVVRPHPPAVEHNNFSFARNRFTLEDQPILKLIEFAYTLNAHQVVNAPGWTAEDHWDLSGTTNLANDATIPQEQQLIRQLLVERFGLQFHQEKREMPVYALQVLKDQPKLTAAADANAQPLEWSQGHDRMKTENYRSNTMSDFLLVRQLFMDRPLVDQTGLTGRYDFALSYSYADASTPDPDAPPPLFTAIKEQLGLKFEPVKAPVDVMVMVIEHIAKPTEN